MAAVRSTAIALGPQSSTPAAVSAYREFEPPSTLAETIACTWEGQEGWSRALRVLPDGCVDLTWDGRAVRVAGAIPSPVRHLIDAHADNVGIRLKPGWAPRVIGVPACHLPPVLEPR